MNDALRKSYEGAVQEMRDAGFVPTSAARGVLDIHGKPLLLPPWERVEPTTDELHAASDLKSPIVLISLPGVSLETRKRVAGIYVCSPLSNVPGNDPYVRWNPADPDSGETCAQRLQSGFYPLDPVDVLVMDGSPEVPDYSLGQGAPTDLLLPDLDAYFALQFRGKKRGQPFDLRTNSWLDAYLLRSKKLAIGGSRPDGNISLYHLSPDDHNRSIGARRMIRLREKS